MGVFKAPKPPDPYATATAQGAANKEAGVTSAEMSMIDQITPDGNLTYKSLGKTTSGNPRWQAITELNPIMQEAKTYEQMADRDTNRLATTVLGNAQELLSKPVSYDEESIKARTDRMINPRLADRFQKDESSLRNNLINRGIREGSQQFNDAMLSFNQGKTDAYSSEALNSRQQALQELGMEQREAINTIGALLGTGQISAPQFVSTPRTNVEAAPIAQLINSNYQSKVQRNNAMLGGLFGLGGSLLSAGTRMATGGAGG
jgi:hypothetical protein